MSLEKIDKVPDFDHGLSEYFLSQMKSESDREAVKTYFVLKRGLEWNNNATVLLNNAVVELQKSINENTAEINNWKEKMNHPMEVLGHLLKKPIAITAFISGTAITAFLGAVFSKIIK